MDTNLDCVFSFTKTASHDLLVLNPLIAVVKVNLGNIFHYCGHVVLRANSGTVQTSPEMLLGTVEQVNQDSSLFFNESLKQEQYLRIFGDCSVFQVIPISYTY